MLTPEEKEAFLIKVRAALGLYSHPEHGWRRIKTVDTASSMCYEVEIADRGKMGTRCYRCTAEGVFSVVEFLRAADYTFTEPKYPELQQFFNKAGQPKTDATVLMDAIEEMSVEPKTFGLENLFKNFN